MTPARARNDSWLRRLGRRAAPGALSVLLLATGAAGKAGGGGGDGAGNLPVTYFPAPGYSGPAGGLDGSQGFLDPRDDGALAREESRGALAFVVVFDRARLPEGATAADFLVSAVSASPFAWSPAAADRAALTASLAALAAEPALAGLGVGVVVFDTDPATGALVVRAAVAGL